MKKKILLLLLFYSCLIQSQDILWEKSYGGLHADYLFDAQPTADYGFILAGSSLSDKTGNKTNNNHGDLDYWVWKMDEKGNLDWQKSFGGSGFDLLQSIKNTRDGGFILAGTSNSPITPEGGVGNKKDDCKGLTDFWVIKLDAKGEEQWQKTIGGSGQDELLCAFQTKDGGYMLGGSSSSSIINNNDIRNSNENKVFDAKPDLYGKSEKCRGNMDYWIVKLDKTGTVQWQKTYGGEYADVLRSMEQTKDGGYILGGYSNSPRSGDKTEANSGIGDYWIVKVSDIGTIEWQKTYGGNGDNQLYVIQQTEEGGYIAGGNSNSTNPLTPLGGMVNTGTDYWLLKLNEKGEVIWSKTYDFGKTDILTSLVENKDHTYLIGGYAQSESIQVPKGGPNMLKVNADMEGINDYIALKISDTGEELWNKTVGSKGEDILRKLIETRDGGYLLAGTSNAKSSRDKNSNIGSNDFWVVKLKDKTKLEKAKVSVEVIPNPAITYTNIIIGYEFETGTATLVDMAGRILQQFSITRRTVPIDLSRYPDGVYVVNIKTNVQSDGVKVIKGTNN
ncbi:T9SS type A sorting domain-containing protein [Flavobacterium hiemivividum]|uniref:T9SS type A sorting domain-containing protein n=1 Tax=Flavobacterium hiemivividum TaxID=2541734 RepID=A0A4R5D0N3_9FLAO|nr:T9SS type A sorting domain-containing protein [Flavobacterium hiemivividum]TDE03743.1 T9SS type A sorting domain-containing protein [Flavobacterium hiemivividum]